MERAVTLPIIAAMWREFVLVAPAGVELKSVSPLDAVIADGTASDELEDPDSELLSERGEVLALALVLVLELDLELELEFEFEFEFEGLVMPPEMPGVVPGLMELVTIVGGFIEVDVEGFVDAAPAVTMAK